MTATRYFLGPNIFFCAATRYWVFLDVTKDRYFCIRKEDLDSLSPWLHGWPRDGDVDSPPTDMPEGAGQLIEQLIARDILCKIPDRGKPVIPTNVQPPDESLASKIPRTDSASLIKHAGAFLLACGQADRRLRTQSFYTVVTHVTQRRQRAGERLSSFDWIKAAQLTTLFDSLRLLYPRPYLCLFDSLALLEFLSRYSIFPNWVYGVIVEPFQAHCWVQQEGVVLNDTVDRVSVYTPIMTI